MGNKPGKQLLRDDCQTNCFGYRLKDCQLPKDDITSLVTFLAV